MPSEHEVLDSMRHIMDPDLGRDIVSCGFIKNLKIEGGHVSFTLELTTPACPLKNHFLESCKKAVSGLAGVTGVEVTLSAQAPRRFQGKGAPGVTENLKDIETVIAVSACKGGVGKSTVASHLAMAMAREGLAVGLLDTDIYGPSFPTLFNKHRPQVFGHANKIVPLNIHGLKVMSLGFVLGESPAVMRGPMVSNYTAQILLQTDWGKLDYLIIDMPPGTGDVQLTIVQQVALDGAVIISTPQALSLVDVAKGILMFEKVNVPVLGVVENMCSFTCDGCGKVHYPFGRSQGMLQDRFGLQTLAELPIVPGVSDLSSPNAGADMEVMAQLAENVHRAVGKSRAGQEELPDVVERERAVQLTWPDGFVAEVPNRALRAACPCAVCVDEHTGEKLLDPASIPEDIRFSRINYLGNYAISFEWTDGHTTGIYSWDYLRSLAQQASVKAEKA
ncbi:MAG: P-loop NTPase [Candidatus Hydrogenedentales bacterium]|jgi:ATP-binding protein involved in chromosome partitioning